MIFLKLNDFRTLKTQRRTKVINDWKNTANLNYVEYPSGTLSMLDTQVACDGTGTSTFFAWFRTVALASIRGPMLCPAIHSNNELALTFEVDDIGSEMENRITPILQIEWIYYATPRKCTDRLHELCSDIHFHLNLFKPVVRNQDSKWYVIVTSLMTSQEKQTM